MLTWDRSHDYVLYRFRNDVTRVTIRFRESPPSVRELIALRRCLPQVREMAPASVRELIGDSEEFSLGDMPTTEARRLMEAVQAEGFEVTAESASFVRHLPFDRTTGCVWLIENEVEVTAITQAMLAAGVPVQDVEE